MGRANRVTVFRTGTCVLSLWLFFSAGTARADWICAAGETSCKTVFIVHNAWHAAIVLDRGDLSLDALPELSDFPDAEFIEFSWGDQDYFPDPNSGIWAALRAAFWSGGSVLHLVGFNEKVAQFYGRAKIFELRLTAAAERQLILFISQTFARTNSNSRAQARPGLFPYSRFYPATAKFSVLRTCNTWVAEALASAGLPISPGAVLTAGSLASQLVDVGNSN
jgi:uncharacterized protein (TIGR02117 family)